MKKSIFCLMAALTITTAFAGDKKEKQSDKLKVEATREEWSKHLVRLQQIQSYIQNTNLPHLEVVGISNALDSLGLLIVPQLQAQLADTAKKK